MREDVRAERRDIQMNADSATIKKFGKEIGADFVLLGVVGTIKDEVKSRYVMYYQTDLELINIETNEKVWIGEKKLKKDIKKKSFKLGFGGCSSAVLRCDGEWPSVVLESTPSLSTCEAPGREYPARFICCRHDPGPTKSPVPARAPLWTTHDR